MPTEEEGGRRDPPETGMAGDKKGFSDRRI